MKKSLATLALLAALGVFSTVTQAGASPVLLGTFTFNCMTNNTGYCGSVTPQMTAELWGEALGSSATFKIFNDKDYPAVAGYSSTITEVYFDNSTPRSLGTFTKFETSQGVNFTQVSAPKNAPGYLGSGFQIYFDAAQDGAGAGKTSGIDRGEWLALEFSLSPGVTAGNLAALVGDDPDDLKIGLHVQSINGGTSEGMVTSGQVPEPASMLLLGTGLLGAGFAARRRKN